VEGVIAAIGAALADAELTVDELTEAIADRTGDWAVEQTMEAFQSRWPRWRQLMPLVTAGRRAVIRALSGLSAVRYSPLDDRPHCIFMRRPLWSERPLMPARHGLRFCCWAYLMRVSFGHAAQDRSPSGSAKTIQDSAPACPVSA
jgi:hypothetical protein